ncbi:DUF1474 family protein [Macrococcoides caseolyticum]|uniref:type II toxin-antitoxin system toxin TscT n=1 Tax=Macrococcoides caseolyticum TaxID=69966 RepID=UPI000C33CF2A|nr:DUF1474 family protein [Macrococcus caseolyticus]PKE20729.1 hypothetical protein CW688_10990 [Macrococcus caseolyticus]PKE71376.1 hypothetical protein CW665_10815 [Macrococcus caseolyticus]PKF05329.1 hypothetical protein CW698_10555 [Macrococcus caseolyticus]
MDNLKFRLENIEDSLRILKERMDNLSITHNWYVDDYFTTELKTYEDRNMFAFGFYEMKIKSEQTKELLEKHSQDMTEIFKEIELLKNEIKGVSDHEEK